MSAGGIGAAGIRALYLAYFTYVGLFSPYLSLYLAAIGLSIAQIGVLMALPQVLRIVGPPFWGWMADRGGSRVLLLRVSSVGAFLSALLLPWAGDRFAALLPVLALLFFMTAAQMPIGETIAMRDAGGDAGRYGRIRIWGSAGFIVGVVAMGPVLDAWGMRSLPWWMAAILVALAASTWMLRAVPAPQSGPPAMRVRERLRQPRVQAFFASAFLMLFAHAALLVGFQAILQLLAQLFQAAEGRHGLGQIVVERRKLLDLDLVELEAEMNLLAGQFLVGIVGGEFNVELLLVAAFQAHQVVDEPGNEVLGAHFHQVVGSRAPVHVLAIQRRAIVHQGQIAQFQASFLGQVDQLGLAGSQFFHGGVDLLAADILTLVLEFKAFVALDGKHGFDFEGDFENQFLAAVVLDQLPAWLGNRLQVVLAQRFREGRVDHLVDDVPLEVLIGDVFLSHRKRHFAGAESGEAKPPGGPSKSFLICVLDPVGIHRNFQGALEQ